MQTAQVLSAAVVLLLSVASSQPRSTPSSPTYTAAVVEFHRTEWSAGTTSHQRSNANLQRVYDHIQNLNAAVDIVLFPELAIIEGIAQANAVPAATDRVAPCGNASYTGTAMHTLSCAAAERQVYVVANLFTGELCAPEADPIGCPEGRRFHNTNVAFDRQGTVVSVYRKFNVYYERNISSTGAEPDNATFRTDFGVRFGHMICFDILFQKPAHRLLADGVRDLLFPSLWYSELPALTAVQLQQGWAQAHGVNLLAAGIARPQQGSTGSGIYSGSAGALGPVVMGTAGGGDRVLVHVVPKVPGAIVREAAEEVPTAAQLNRPLEGLQLMRERLEDVVAWRPVNVSAETVTHRLCTADGGFCCQFEHQLVNSVQQQAGGEAVAVNTSSYEYIAAVQRGERTFGGSDDHLKVFSCAVIACANNTELETCARLLPAAPQLRQRFVFRELTVSGVFPAGAAMVVPATLAPALVPLPVEMYEWLAEERTRRGDDGLDYRHISINLTANRSQQPPVVLLSFGMYGRDFRSAATANGGALLLLVLSTAVVMMSIARSLSC